tara:strand:- start:203 stop:532 length:330 start_codon:yes stop_codon:yes gene_type:complete
MGRLKKSKYKSAIEIELTYDNVDFIPNLIEEEGFAEHILCETYNSISYAAENNLNKIDIFNIVNLGYNVSIKKCDYIPILNKVLKMYEKKEDYLECATVKNLIQYIENE